MTTSYDPHADWDRDDRLGAPLVARVGTVLRVTLTSGGRLNVLDGRGRVLVGRDVEVTPTPAQVLAEVARALHLT